MNIEKDIFKRGHIDFNKLIEYGFKLKNDEYIFEKIFIDDFKAIIIIDKKGNVNGKVIDIQMNEEYFNIRTNMNGSFVSMIREEYKKLLIDIKNNCFKNEYFIYDQSNRITKYIYNKYKVEPEFLWDKTPGCGVFRKKNNSKWFGIIMNIDKSKIDSGSGEVEVINLKINEKEIIELLNEKGFYKAYHMNKKYWITVLLDDTVADEIIFSLIDESFSLLK